MKSEHQQHYPIMMGVEMKPGVAVFCHDRDSIAYDLEGIIATAAKTGNGWTFGVVFNQPDGSPNLPYELDDSQIWPDQTEQKKDDAKQRRAEQELQVFLCHGSEDKASVRILHSKIAARGMHPWLDEVNIEPGTEWDDAIRRAIKATHILLVILSKKSVDKVGYVQKEIRFALDRAEEMPEGRVFIIPTLLDDCELPSRLNRWQAVRLNQAGGEERLFTALRKRASDIAREA